MPFLSNSEKALDKIRRNFSVFEENKDNIRIIWHPYTRTEEFLKLNNCDCIDEYKKLIDYYKNNDLGDFNEDDNFESIADLCDAYYGDFSDIISFFSKKNKPVMIQNIDL